MTVNANHSPQAISAQDTRKRDLEINNKAIFGSVEAGFYCRHLNPEFGVPSGVNGRTSVWVESKEDFARFGADLQKEHSMLRKSWGYNAACVKCDKHLSVIGSIAANDWTAKFVNDCIHQPMPLIFLPHIAPQSGTSIEEAEFSKILSALDWGESVLSGKLPPLNSNTFPHRFPHYEIVLRYRLRHFPTEYELFILNLIRSLYTRIHYLSGGLLLYVPDAQKKVWGHNLAVTTYETALHGITMGIESLIYHAFGLGLSPDDFDTATKYLAYLRQHGPCTPRDLSRRFQTVPTPVRDRLIGLFTKEQLVTLDKQRIIAVPCRDFFASLPDRLYMPLPPEWEDHPSGPHTLLPGEDPP